MGGFSVTSGRSCTNQVEGRRVVSDVMLFHVLLQTAASVAANGGGGGEGGEEAQAKQRACYITSCDKLSATLILPPVAYHQYKIIV